MDLVVGEKQIVRITLSATWACEIISTKKSHWDTQYSFLKKGWSQCHEEQVTLCPPECKEKLSDFDYNLMMRGEMGLSACVPFWMEKTELPTSIKSESTIETLENYGETLKLGDLWSMVTRIHLPQVMRHWSIHKTLRNMSWTNKWT